MDTEFEKFVLEQPEGIEEEALRDSAPHSDSAMPARARPRGRPWAKGQSGNPAGRPRRIHSSAAAVDYVIGRKSIRLAKTVRDLALAGDTTMLKLWYQDVTATRRAAPDGAGMPMAADRAELRALRKQVAEAPAKGAITEGQADALVRIVNTVLGML